MITLYKGDDTGGQLGKNVKIVFHCDDAVDMDDVVVKFDLLGIVKREFTDVHDGDILDIFISHAESRKFPLGVIFAKMWGEDASGKLRTFANRIPFRVTLNLIAVYGSDGTDSQDIHVYSSVDWDSIANKPTVFPSSVEEVEGLQEALDEINGKIPEDASADNQLADKDWVDQEIDRVAAYYITSDAQGNPFSTRAALLNAETYYSGGSPRTPTRNDYAIVLADETHDDTEWRYIYSVNEQGVGTWEAQYPVEGAIVADDNVTKTSTNPVKSSGIWAAIWGALAATTGFSSMYDWVVAQLGFKRDYTDLSYNTQVTVNAPALHAILTSRGTQLLEYYLPCTEDVPATPEINHVYTWRRDGAEFYITQGVSTLTTIWTLYNSSDEQLARITTDNATQGYFPDLTFETSAYAAVTSTKVNSYPDEVQDALALDSNVPAASTSLPRMDSPNGAVVGTSASYARGDHVHPTDTSRVPTSRTVNGKPLSANVKLTGADIAVSGTDATKIDAALAGKASTADATLINASDWVCSPTKVGITPVYIVQDQSGAWYPSNGEGGIGMVKGDAQSLSLSWAADEWYGGVALTATRAALGGYVLGSQTGKPLASEAEAEALRTGKQDALSAQQLANIAAVPSKANRASNPTAGNLAALDAQGNPTDSGIAACDLLTIVTLSDSTETMASILARLNAINAAHKHVFFDCSGIDVNPRLYLCTIMIDADANAVRIYDQVTGKLYIGPYVAAETIGEVFAKAVDAYHSITVSAVTLDGVTVTGQTVTIREGTDATAPVYATATITDGAPVTFVVPKGMIYFLEITDALADHFGPRVTSGSGQGIATADAAVTFTYYDAEHIDISEITTFAKLQEALTWFGTNEVSARNNLVGIEIADTWTATNGTVYDNPRVVWDVHYFEDENGVSHLGALMGTKYCSYNDVQFDAAEGEECDSSTETVAEAGVYYYGLALGQTSKTAANLTLLELSTGDALPYTGYAKIYKSAIRDTTRNSLLYGYNNWRDSAYRQYLNSDAATGQWWGATHIGDVAPSQLNSVRGFMAGCSAALLAAAKKVKVATWPNYITDGPNQITTLYETLDTFFLPSGSEVYGDVNRNGGASVEGELSPYWQARTGYTAPNNAATSTRIIYRELPVGSTASRSSSSVRLRSAYRGSSHSVWHVAFSGQVYYSYASGANASVPACVIY